MYLLFELFPIMTPFGNHNPVCGVQQFTKRSHACKSIFPFFLYCSIVYLMGAKAILHRLDHNGFEMKELINSSFDATLVHVGGSTFTCVVSVWM